MTAARHACLRRHGHACRRLHYACGYHALPYHAETLAYLERLQQAVPDKIRLEIFGTTPEGRPMTVVIASGDGTFTPQTARAMHKPVVLVQAGIHPGEIEGSESIPRLFSYKLCAQATAGAGQAAIAQDPYRPP